MKVEVGQFYRTRGGDKAAVLGINPFCGPESRHYLVGGTLYYNGRAGSDSWSASGCYFGNDGDVSPKDLIAAWQGPRTVEVFVYRRENGERIATTAAMPDSFPGFTLVARKTITEGEGMPC